MSKKKVDGYAKLTSQILSQIEETGKVPWRKTWDGRGSSNECTSMSTGNAYRGINQLYLRMLGRESKHWGTYNVIKKNGGQIRKGEKGSIVLFYRWIDREKVKADGTVQIETFMAGVTVNTVFNAEQADWPDGIPEKYEPVPEEEGLFDDQEILMDAQSILDGYLKRPGAPGFDHKGGDRAFYALQRDRVSMPRQKDFDSPEEYYSTAFHEIGHSTGHESRLKREMGGHPQSHNYGFEELVAEFTACFLSEESGIVDCRDNSAAYLANWAARLKESPKMLMQAAGKASKAAEFILEGAKIEA